MHYIPHPLSSLYDQICMHFIQIPKDQLLVQMYSHTNQRRATNLLAKPSLSIGASNRTFAKKPARSNPCDVGPCTQYFCIKYDLIQDKYPAKTRSPLRAWRTRDSYDRPCSPISFSRGSLSAAVKPHCSTDPFAFCGTGMARSHNRWKATSSVGQPVLPLLGKLDQLDRCQSIAEAPLHAPRTNSRTHRHA